MHYINVFLLRPPLPPFPRATEPTADRRAVAVYAPALLPEARGSEAGNSEVVCKRHYLETLTREEGSAWFKIRRSKAGAEPGSMDSAKAA